MNVHVDRYLCAVFYCGEDIRGSESMLTQPNVWPSEVSSFQGHDSAAFCTIARRFVLQFRV